MSTILDTHQDPNYEPSQSEIIEYGKWLGMELPGDEHLLWIAREGLKAPLPEHWKACKSEKGELYYFNFRTGQSIWDHPLDEHYKELLKKERENPSTTSSSTKAATSSTTTTPKRVPSSATSSEAVVAEKQAAVAHQVTSNHHQPASNAASTKQLKADKGLLPPSGKSASSAQPQHHSKSEKSASLPALGSATSKTSAASASSGASSGSEDDKSAASSVDSDAALTTTTTTTTTMRSTGKLKELKTLKTKKDMPEELRLDGTHATAATATAAVTTTVAATNGAVTAEAGTGTINGRVPLGSTTTAPIVSGKSSVQQLQQPVEAFHDKTSAAKCSPIAAIPSMHDADDGEAMIVADAATTKKRAVSFSNEEVAVAQAGASKKQKDDVIQQIAAALDKFREEENAKAKRSREEFVAQLESNLRKAKEALSRRNDQILANYETELREETRTKKTKIAQEADNEVLQFRRAEQEQVQRRIATIREDSSRLLADTISTMRGTAAEACASLLDAVRAEQRNVTAAVDEAQSAELRLISAGHAERMESLRASLIAEQNAAAQRIRDVQTECSAHVAAVRAEHEATVAAMQSSFEETKRRLSEDHQSEIKRLVSELRAQATDELQVLRQEFAQQSVTAKESHSGSSSHKSNIMTTQQQQQHASLSSDVKPLSTFAIPPAFFSDGRRAAAGTHLSVEAVAATGGGPLDAEDIERPSSSDESTDASLTDLAHSLHAATQTATPLAGSGGGGGGGASRSGGEGDGEPMSSSGATQKKASPISLSGSLLSPTKTQDLRTLITEALRDVFKGSPFIIPSPTNGQSNGGDQASAPPQQHATTVVEEEQQQQELHAFGRIVDLNVAAQRDAFSMRAGAGKAAAEHALHIQQPRSLTPTPGTHAHPPHHHALSNSVGLSPMNVSVTPESFQEQRKLLVDERRRLDEAKAFVDNQRTSLEARRLQLKAARRHWKSDVLAAKAQGVAANSRKGMLLQKVHEVLDKQAVGLQHDDLLLQDSEHWLKTKEQRLVKLEAQMDEHERLRHAAQDCSVASVDTAALVTGFFKPNALSQHHRHSDKASQLLLSSGSGGADGLGDEAVPLRSSLALRSAKTPPPSRSISPLLSKALERIERRLEKVASLVATSTTVAEATTTMATAPDSGLSVSAPHHNHHHNHQKHHHHHSSSGAGRRRTTSSAGVRSSSRNRHVDFDLLV